MMDESSNKNKNEKATDTFREVKIFRIDISYNENTAYPWEADEGVREERPMQCT